MGWVFMFFCSDKCSLLKYAVTFLVPADDGNCPHAHRWVSAGQLNDKYFLEQHCFELLSLVILANCGEHISIKSCPT